MEEVTALRPSNHLFAALQKLFFQRSNTHPHPLTPTHNHPYSHTLDRFSQLSYSLETKESDWFSFKLTSRYVMPPVPTSYPTFDQNGFFSFLPLHNSFFSRVLRDSTTRFVGPSVRPSVGPSVTLYFFWVFAVFGLTAPAQMIEWPHIQPLPTRTRLG